MPRVYGGSPGSGRSGFSGRPAPVYSRRISVSEMVVKRARPFSSRLTPVAAPIGRSGDFSSAGRRVSDSQRRSSSEGWWSGAFFGFLIMPLDLAHGGETLQHRLAYESGARNRGANAK